MKKTLTTLFIVIQMAFTLLPTNTYAQTETLGFTRGKGFFIRPELYGAALAEFGYQINPNLQFSVGAGVELAQEIAVPELVLGMRAYASDTKWTAFFDYHYGLILIGGFAFSDHRLSVGPSYKNFDFGGGIAYMIIDGVGVWAPCLNIGFNFRFPNKQ